MMWGYGYGPMAGLGFGFGWILMILFWVVIIWLIVSLVRHGGGMCHGGKCGHGRGDDAMEILKQRYAKGEINKEEFERMKKDLQ